MKPPNSSFNNVPEVENPAGLKNMECASLSAGVGHDRCYSLQTKSLKQVMAFTLGVLVRLLNENFFWIVCPAIWRDKISYELNRVLACNVEQSLEEWISTHWLNYRRLRWLWFGVRRGHCKVCEVVKVDVAHYWLSLVGKAKVPTGWKKKFIIASICIVKSSWQPLQGVNEMSEGWSEVAPILRSGRRNTVKHWMINHLVKSGALNENESPSLWSIR